MDWLDLPVANAARGIIELPGSKSISNRILLLAALANGKTLVRNLLISDDTAQMLNALGALGIKINQISENDYSVEGASGKFPVKQADLFLGNAGTAFRPLVAVLAIMGGHYRLSGVARMHERPIADLVNALRQLNASITYRGNEGFPPLEIKPAEIQSKTISIKGDVSSQFLSGLLMALPLTGKTATIIVNGILISRPYVELTLAQMARFGVQVIQENWQRFTLSAPQTYKSPGEIIVEGDASSASYFLAAGAIGGGPVRVEGVGTESLQGDIHFADALEKMGAQIRKGKNWIESSSPISNASRQQLKAIDLDCNHIPDAAMTLATTALFAKGTTTLRNIASWRVKETDRISAMAKELRKVGALIEEGKDFIRITPPATLLTPHAIIDTYDDHRMAMCFSLVSLGAPLRINNPGCVTKTFPDYFEKFAMIMRS
ncbi:3-phosphoshikimate 1-carboxyvinyltransferase [Nitrosomonas sp. Is37]|uniref:3-phosphoshikimate 1-carboxyvinyltransferase n=1 Tax=Nitrosomonas sp. Is37 TaxID=3080535 RepID=UPI00294B3205|nr:3-phosphoshikimate 1-carboxyvinyltransferase [Nitrosomonas sp. Is37]MDV6344361.1 3-phosphoshikimate 1-carboxyvinyltransferase [Nitrosomonas sp. Is37]